MYECNSWRALELAPAMAKSGLEVLPGTEAGPARRTCAFMLARAQSRGSRAEVSALAMIRLGANAE